MLIKISKHAQNAESLLKSIFYISLFSGFMILFFYSTKIHYFPVNNLNSAIYFLLLMALIGFLFFMGIVFPLAFSPYLWLTILKEQDLCTYIFDKNKAEYYSKNFSEGKLSFSNYDAFMLLAIYFFTYAIAFLIWISIVWLISITPNIYWIMILIPLILISLILIADKIDKKNKYACWFYLGVAALPCSIFHALAFIIVAKFSLWGKVELFINFLICFISSGYFLFPSKGKISIKFRILFSSLTTCSLLVLLAGPGNFSYKVLQNYGIGGIDNVNLLVDSHECLFLNMNSKTPICRQEGELHIVSNAILLWRSGEYILRSKKDSNQTFILPLNKRTVVYLKEEKS
ncbi:MAG: hypothetical protein H0U57_06515 [Tatlockia sp.]|nr:hypothetical protein [Tatlockia sp.]